MSGLPAEKDEVYYQGLNGWLLRAVPPEARTVLEIGCAEGRLGAVLRQERPDRRVYGVEMEPGPARAAAARLDGVFQMDVEKSVPDLPPGSVDCMLFGDVLEHLREPVAALRRLLPLLSPDGTILCCIPNVQHHSVVTALLRGDFQYQKEGIMDATHLRFFTYASFTKILLDAGLEPELVDRIPSPPPAALVTALTPALRLAGVSPPLAEAFLGSYQYIFRGRPLRWIPGEREEPLSFVACVNDEAQFQDNLAASPCLRGATVHELVTVRGATSAAEGLQAGIARAHNGIVVLVHQDVYLPDGWPSRFRSAWRDAEGRHGRPGVAGVYGVRRDPDATEGSSRAGHVVDRWTLLRETHDLPSRVDTLDEVLLALPRDTPLRLDPALGFHLYGSDLALQARERGLPAVALDALCFHNSLTGTAVPPAFHDSALVLREKWRSQLPIVSSCGVLR